MNKVMEHFDSLADTYDSLKRKNWYYYENLKRIVRRFIPPRSKVLEIGTATGEILAALEPSEGVGIDISPAMIAVAAEKFKSRKELRFIAGTVETVQTGTAFDYCVLVDVIEHVENLPSLAGGISAIAGPGTAIVITMANPLWEPLLLLLEKLKLKMPEGKHYRVSGRSLARIFAERGLALTASDTFVICPMHIPFVSGILNTVFHRIPLINRLGLIQCFVFKHHENKHP